MLFQIVLSDWECRIVSFPITHRVGISSLSFFVEVIEAVDFFKFREQKWMSHMLKKGIFPLVQILKSSPGMFQIYEDKIAASPPGCWSEEKIIGSGEGTMDFRIKIP